MRTTFTARFIILTLLLLGTSVPAHAQTQLEMNENSADKFASADAKLNATYKKILAQRKSHPVFIEKFKASQRAWIIYRDATLEAYYPVEKDEDTQTLYGSVHPLCWSELKTLLTEQRNQELKKWLTPAQEGDVCSGSTESVNR